MENKKERVQGYVSRSLKESMKKYSAKNDNVSESQIINEALLQFFKIKSAEDNLDFLVSIIENTIHKELDSKLNRIISLNAKSTKSALSSQFLLVYFLSYIFKGKVDKEYLKDKLKLADEMGYKATKIPSIDGIEKILPDDLNFDIYE